MNRPRTAALVTWAYAAMFGVPAVPVAIFLAEKGGLPSLLGMFDMYAGPWSARFPDNRVVALLLVYFGLALAAVVSGWLLWEIAQGRRSAEHGTAAGGGSLLGWFCSPRSLVVRDRESRTGSPGVAGALRFSPSGDGRGDRTESAVELSGWHVGSSPSDRVHVLVGRVARCDDADVTASGEPLELLVVANDEFARRLRLVGPDDWRRPTPCSEWDVRALVNHVVGANVRYQLLLSGAPTEQVEATRTVDHLGGDAWASFVGTADVVVACFHQDGTLERIAHHATGDRTGRELLSMRILDAAIHGWDLARAIGADETLDEDVVAFLLAYTAGLDLGPAATCVRTGGQRRSAPRVTAGSAAPPAGPSPEHHRGG